MAFTGFHFGGSGGGGADLNFHKVLYLTKHILNKALDMGEGGRERSDSILNFQNLRHEVQNVF